MTPRTSEVDRASKAIISKTQRVKAFIVCSVNPIAAE